MKSTGYGASQAGTKHEVNEDSFYMNAEQGLYIVCDGLGGHAAGQKASKMAVDHLKAFFDSHIELSGPDSLKVDHDGSILRFIRLAIESACSAIYEAGISNDNLRGMGSTVSLLLIGDGVAYIGHVGDSRIYLRRGGAMHQLTKDHTFIQDMVDRKLLTETELENSPYSHVLTRALGIQSTVAIDTLQLELLAEDLFLLCSDGVFGELKRKSDFDHLVLKQESKKLPEALLDLALSQKASDDLTALVVEVQLEEQEASSARHKEALLKLELLEDMYMFKGLALPELARIVERSFVLDIPAGKELFKQDEIGESMYLILTGALEVKRDDKVIATLIKGNHVGEMSLLSGEMRSAGVKALEDARLLKLSKDDFESFLLEEPVAGVRLLKSIASELSVRLYQADQKLSAAT